MGMVAAPSLVWVPISVPSSPFSWSFPWPGSGSQTCAISRLLDIWERPSAALWSACSAAVFSDTLPDELWKALVSCGLFSSARPRESATFSASTAPLFVLWGWTLVRAPSWGNTVGADLICLSSLKDHCPLLPVVSRLEITVLYNFVWFILFCQLFL